MSSSLETYRKWQPFLLGLCTAIGLIAGMNMRQAQSPSIDPEKVQINSMDRIQKFADIMSYIQSKYIDSINIEQSTDLAIDAWLSSLDPYSDYIPRNEIQEFTNRINGTSQEIGLNLVILNSKVIIQDVRHGSEAEKVGISSGDLLLAINGSVIQPTPYYLDSIVASIYENPSDSVALKWLDRSNGREIFSKLGIIKFKDKAIDLAFIPETGIIYLKLKILSKDSYREFMNVLEEYTVQKKAKRLIIDLRGNRGGIVHEAASILNQLVSEKDLLLFKTSGFKIPEKEFKATGKPFFKLEKIIILVDEETASAAELIAASLQDLDRAMIIGCTTYGKGTVLEQYSLPDGSAIRLAVSRFITHSGRSIQKPYESQEGNNYFSQPIVSNDKVYKSIKKRSMKANQGVDPDIELFTDSIKFDSFYQRLVIESIDDHFEKIKLISDMTVENIILNKDIQKIIKNDFIKYQTRYPNSKLLENIFRDQFYSKINLWLFGETAYQKQLLNSDPIFQRAMLEIKN